MTTAFRGMGADAAAAFSGEFSGRFNALSSLFGDIGAAGGAIAGITVGLGMVGKELVNVGEQFETMHRQLMTFTTDAGGQFDELNRRAVAMVGTLDTSIKNLGSTMAMLETRLRTGPSDALDSVTHSVIELQDRLGQFSVSELAGTFRFWGISVNEANDALATLLETTRRNGISMSELLQTMSAAGPNLRELNLSYDQAAELIGRLTAEGLNATQAITMLTRAEKGAASQHEELATFIRNENAIIQQLVASHQEARANEEAFLAYGIRNWPLATAAAQDLVDVSNTMPGTFERTASSMDQFIDKTRELHNVWNQFTNDFMKAAAPEAGWMVQGLTAMAERMDRIATGTASWKDELIGVGHVLGGLGVVGIGVSIGEAALRDHPQPPNQPEPVWGGSSSLSPDYAGVGGGFPVLPGGAPNQPGTPGAQPPAGPDFLGGAGGWLTPPEQGGLNRPPLVDQDKQKGGRLPAAPEIPYPATYGQPPAPGESLQDWSRAQQLIRDQHDVSEAEARVEQLKHDNDATHDDVVKAENRVVEARGRVLRDQLEADKPGREQQAQVPKPVGYGAPPRPGESSQVYGAEQGALESRWKTAQALARVQQVQDNPQHTSEQLIAAENTLADARKDEWQSVLRLNDALTKGRDKMTEFGAELDKDFGLSKGLSGLAENLFKFLANLAFAPVFGALGGATAAMGGVPDGASGLIGAAAVGGAFGPQFTGSATGVGAIPSASLPGNPSTPAEFAAAGGSIASLYAFANSMVGTPYSQQLRNDCSGMVSRLVNVALGMGPQVSFDTTGEGAYLAAHGFQPGIAPPGSSALQVGWNPQPGNAGHTAATLPGGVHAESGGSVGGFTLGGPVGGESDQFSQHAFLTMSGAGSAGGGRAGGFGGAAGTVPVFVVNMPTGGFNIPVPGDASGGFGGGASGGAPGSGNFGSMSSYIRSKGAALGLSPTEIGMALAVEKQEGLGPSGNPSMGFGPEAKAAGFNFDANPQGAVDQFFKQYMDRRTPDLNPNDPRSVANYIWHTVHKAADPNYANNLLRNFAPVGGAGAATPGSPNTQVNIPQTPAEQAIREGKVPSHPGVSMPPGYDSGGEVGLDRNVGGPDDSPVGAPGDMARIPSRDQMPWGFSTGSTPYFGGSGQPVPIVAHGGEWVIRKDAVDHYGAGMMAAINARSFDEGGLIGPPPPPSPPPGQIGPFPVPPQVAAPGNAPNAGPQPPQPPAPPPAPPVIGTQHQGSGAAPGPSRSGQNPTVIGGGDPEHGHGQGAHGTGGGAIGAATQAAALAADAFAPGSGVAVQIASQELQRLIQYGAQVTGALTQGVLETVLPTGGSKLAQNNWITKIASGVAGVRPQIPNLAGKPAGPQPDTTPGALPPLLANPPAAQPGPRPGPGQPAAPGQTVPLNPFDKGGWWQPGTAGVNLTSRAELVLSPTQLDQLTAESMIGDMGRNTGRGGGTPGNTHNGPIVHIENYRVGTTEDRAGADLSRQLQAAYGGAR